LKSYSEPAAVQLLEQGFESVRRRPMVTLAAYQIGTMPFLAGLLMFGFEMTNGVFAAENLLPSSFLIVLLWVWMIFWQAVYCNDLRSALSNEQDPGWTAKRVWNVVLIQTAAQSIKLIALPAALLVGLPLAWTFAFFQNITIFAGAPTAEIGSTWQRAREAATIWQKQNWTLLGIAAILALAVFINIAVAAFVVSQLARTFLGITTPTLDQPDAFFNSTLLAFAVAVTYACVDPVVKAAHVARSFAAESVRTGADIRVSLQRIITSAVPVVLAVMFCMPVFAQQSRVDPAALDGAIERVLREPEYSWRMERRLAPRAGNSLLDRAADSIASGFRKAGRALGKAIEWLLDLFIDREIEMPGGGVRATTGRRVRNILILLSVLLGAVVIAVAWRLRRTGPTAHVTARTVPAIASVDLTAENVDAAQFEQDEWLKLSDELLARGEPRLALRAIFLGALARLQREGLVTLQPFKTNLDYDRELTRRARAHPEVRPAYRTLLNAFERCWYGMAAPEIDTIQRMRALLKELTVSA
jgi:hypothetical protein